MNVPINKRHDIPIHCKPKKWGESSYESCCVGVLTGFCRKCGKWVFCNDECAVEEEPWGAAQWYENWETVGLFRRELTDEEKAFNEAFRNAPIVIGPPEVIGWSPNWGMEPPKKETP